MDQVIFLLALLALVLGGAGILILIDRIEWKRRHIVWVRFRVNVKQFQRAMRRAGRATRKASKQVERFGSAIRDTQR